MKVTLTTIILIIDCSIIGVRSNTLRNLQPKLTQASSTNECVDSPLGWHDSNGPSFDCSWYAQDSNGNNCADYGNSYHKFGKTANEACCACGGGNRGDSSHTISTVTEEHLERKLEGEFSSRIVGGVTASAGEFPFMVGLYGSSSYPSCGGSLVSPNLVLTAAQCSGITRFVRVGSVNSIGGYNGSPSGQVANVKESIIYPLYDESTGAYDFMLLVLDTDIDTNIYRPINLNFDSAQPATGDMLTVTGFGALFEGGSQSSNLMKVNVPAVSYDTCSSQYSGIQDNIQLCAGYAQGGKDSCQGDSGGPIFEQINGVTTQVGIVSLGEGCARPGKSGVYARISGVSSWLKIEICNRSSAPKPSYCPSRIPFPIRPIRPNPLRPTLGFRPTRPNPLRLTRAPTSSPTRAPTKSPGIHICNNIDNTFVGTSRFVDTDGSGGFGATTGDISIAVSLVPQNPSLGSTVSIKAVCIVTAEDPTASPPFCTFENFLSFDNGAINGTIIATGTPPKLAITGGTDSFCGAYGQINTGQDFKFTQLGSNTIQLSFSASLSYCIPSTTGEW